MPSDQIEITFWRSVQDTHLPEPLEAYLEKFPDGAFASLARIRLRYMTITQQKQMESERIIDAVCAIAHITKQAIVGGRRAARIVRPRQIAAYLMYEMTGLSLPQIGKLLGNRDHTTIMHARRRIAEILESGTEPETERILTAARSWLDEPKP